MQLWSNDTYDSLYGIWLRINNLKIVDRVKILPSHFSIGFCYTLDDICNSSYVLTGGLFRDHETTPLPNNRPPRPAHGCPNVSRDHNLGRYTLINFPRSMIID
jgi:hypothetical protein